jgi:hypothetical protein
VTVGLVLVVAAAWFLGGSTIETLTGRSGSDDFFEGYWPAANAPDAERVQREVDAGEGVWRLDPTEVAQRYGRTMGWEITRLDGVPITPAPPIVRGSAARGWSGDIVLDKANGTFKVQLVGLRGAKRPAWFVAGVRANNIDITKPVRGAATTSPLRFEGSTYSFAGSTRVSIFDDNGKKLGQRVFPVGRHDDVPLRGSLAFKKPATPGGTVLFEESTGSFDTVVRLRFGPAPAPTARPAPDAKVIAAQESFTCYVSARHELDATAARRCSTQRHLAGAVRDIFGARPARLDHAEILDSSKRSDDEIVMYVRSFWTRGGELVSYSRDDVTVLREAGGWKVDRWMIGKHEETGEGAVMKIVFLKPGARCADVLGPRPPLIRSSSSSVWFLSTSRSSSATPRPSENSSQALSRTSLRRSLRSLRRHGSMTLTSSMGVYV